MSSARHSPPIFSRQLLLATSAAIDLAWRIPGDLLAPLLSLLSGLIASESIATVTSWVMFSVALYSFAHLAYPQDDLPTEEPGFRIGFTVGTLPFAYVLHSSPPIGVVLLAGLGTLVYPGAILLLYLRRFYGWSVLDADAEAVALVEFVFPHEDQVREEIRTDLGREGVFGAVGAVLYLLSTMMLLAIPCSLAAIAVEILFDTYPIPDLLFLGWGLGSLVLPRVSTGPSQTWIDDRRTNFEESLFDSVENATRSLFGLVLGLYILIGLFGFGLAIYTAISLAPGFLQPVVSIISSRRLALSPELMLLAWNMLGVVMLLLVAASFGTWAWMREFRRLPYFLDHWEGRELAEQEVVARPPGFVLPPLLSILLVRWYVYTASGRSLTFGFLWIVAIVGLGWTAYRTRMCDPQPIERENVVITGGLVTQIVTVWSLGSKISLTALVGGEADPLQLFAVPLLLSGLIVLLALLPVFERRGRRSGPYRRLSAPLMIVLVGLASGVSLPVVPPEYRTAFMALSGFSVPMGLIWAIVRWYEI